MLHGFGLLLGWTILAASPQAPPWWPAEVEQALARAGENRPNLVMALERVQADQRKGMAFLIANMPDRDLKALTADFLLENVELAYRARQTVPWGKSISEELFLNDVLPYANLDEERHPWRRELFELCLPLIKDCKTPGEAAHLLNSSIFKQLKVGYSMQRKKANQSPKESIEQGKASCTGLSVLLADCCRSVCIPARIAGTPLWSNKRGNHTWVEVWDERWHFTGACEADPQGLDRGWFVGDAAEAQENSRLHAIYASSFKKGNTVFPLPWAPGREDVYAENVTARYAKPRPVAEDRTRVFVRVWKAGKKERLALPVEITERQKPDQVQRGESRGEKNDANDFLTFDLPRNREYLLRVGGTAPVEKVFKTTDEKQQYVDVVLGEDKPGLTSEQSKKVEKAALEYFSANEADRSKWKFDPTLDRLLLDHESAVRQAAWKAFQAAPLHGGLKEDFDKNQVRYEAYQSAYVVKKVGQKPAQGWPLFIAMHGGGNAPKELNDSQWRQMQRYYRDQEGMGGYLYLALRAPNDTWNGFYDTYVPPLIVNLIRQFTLFGEVDPDKVFIMGYSHGGYGAFYIGPKIPDRFAAIHSSAAAPTDGAISAKTLRNTRFTFMVGDQDNAYGRRERCEKFAAEIDKLKQENPGEYPVEFELKKGFGHGGLPDRDKIKDMISFGRNPVPRRVTWEPKDNVLKDFFWLSIAKPENGQSVDATVRDNAVQVTTKKVQELSLHLDSRLIDFQKPLRLTCDGKERTTEVHPQFLTLCRSLSERGDPMLAWTCEVNVHP